MPKAIGYTRVLKEARRRASPGLGAQRAKIASWCAAHDLFLYDVYADREPVEHPFESPGIAQDAFAMALHHCAFLVAFSLPHLSPNPAVVGELARRLKKAGGGLSAIADKINTRTSLGERQPECISRLYKVRYGIKRKESFTDPWTVVGGALGPPAPFGYRREGEHLVPDPEQQFALRCALFRKRAGWSYHKIAGWFSAMERRPWEGGGPKWNERSVRRLLMSARTRTLEERSTSNIKKES